MYTVTVCGGGNAAHVLVGLLGSRSDVSVRWYNTLEDEVQRIQAGLADAGGQLTVAFKDGRADMHGRPERVSAHAAEVVPSSDMIILAIPAFAHRVYFEQIVEHVQPGCIVGVMVAKGGVDWQFKEIFAERLDQVEFFAMENLPWACRIREYGRAVEILGTKLTLDVAVLSEKPERVLGRISDLIALGSPSDPSRPLPEFQLAPNFISCSLRGNLGHACIMYGRWHDWDGSPLSEVPPFYQGVDEFTADVMEQASLEVMAIKQALTEELGLDLSAVIEAKDWLIKVYGDEIVDNSTLQKVITTNRSYDGLMHTMHEVEGGYVPSPRSRYLTEDIPYGILVIRGIAEIMGVQTPMIDRVIEWNQQFMGKEYLVDGHLTGRDIEATRVPQQYGLTTPSSLV